MPGESYCGTAPVGDDPEIVTQRVALLEHRICELQTTVGRLLALLEHGGIGARMIGACQIREKHICNGEVTIQKLSRLPLGQIVFPAHPTGFPRVPQINYRVENIFSGSREAGDPLLDDHTEWRVDIVANRQSGIVTHELARGEMRTFPFNSMALGSFTSPSGHPASALAGHPDPIAHGVSTLLTPLVSIEDGRRRTMTGEGPLHYIPQKRITAFNLDGHTESMNDMLGDVPSAQPQATIGPPAGIGA